MKKLIFSTIIISCLFLSSCGVANQIREMSNLRNCQYDLKDVTDVYIANVSVDKVLNGNISMLDISNLSTAIIKKKIPLQMQVNVNVTNPTTQNAALNSMKWIIEIENTEFARGTNNETYAIQAGKSAIIPLAVTTDIYKLFSDHSIESIKTFMRSFSKDGTSSKIRVRVKPSLNLGGVAIPSPAYINLEKKVGGVTATPTTTNQ